MTRLFWSPKRAAWYLQVDRWRSGWHRTLGPCMDHARKLEAGGYLDANRAREVRALIADMMLEVSKHAI